MYERWSSKEEEHVVVLLCTNKKQASDKQLQIANIIGRLFSDLLPYKISTVTVRRQLDF